MELYSGYINRLIEELSALPGIGNKSAQRLAFHIIGMSPARVNRLAETIRDAKEHVTFCKVCQNLTDEEICPICKNPSRDPSTIMVVENPRDLAAYERTGRYQGLYHVLHGAISPMLGVGPADIRLKELMESNEASNDMKIAAYEAANTAVPRAVTPQFGEYSTILNNAWEDVRNGADVTETLNSAVEQFDQAVSTNQ